MNPSATMEPVASQTQLYSIYGLQFEMVGTPDLLAAVPGAGAVDASLDVRGIPSWVGDAPKHQIYGPPGPPDGEPKAVQVYALTGQPWLLFRFPADINFLVHQNGRQVFGEWPRHYDLAYVAPVIVGPLLGFLLRIHGITTLHASVVEVDGRAVIVTGTGGAGKSTTAAAFAKNGFPVLSDDLAPLRLRDGGCYVAPGYPRICLWPESVRIHFGAADALPLITEGWEKRYLDLAAPDYAFCRTPLPVAAAYWIQNRSDQPDAPFLENMPSMDALTALIGNTYAAEFADIGQSSRDLTLFSTLLAKARVRKVTPHSAPTRLNELCHLIAMDSRNV